MADHGHAGEVEAVERLARRQARFEQVSLDASLSAFGEFEFGQRRQQPRRRPALAIGAFGERLPQLGDGGHAQFAQQQRQARGVDGDAVAHGVAPAVADVGAAIAGSSVS